MAKKTYIFYHDESEHSRKLTENTIAANNFVNMFITANIGVRYGKVHTQFENDYKNFEETYKDKNSNELKSKRLKNIKYGFSSIKNEQELNLINDLFEIFIKNNILTHFSMENKIEYILRQILIRYDLPTEENKSTIYSITKFICVYKPQNVFDAIYKNNGTIVPEIKKSLEKQINLNKNLPHKDKENFAFEHAIDMLQNCNEEFIVDWKYEYPFFGFEKFIEEKNINVIKFILDKEGKINEESKTLLAAKHAVDFNCEEANSQDYYGLRITDMICGLFKYFLKYLSEDVRYKTETDYKNLKFISENWFNLNEMQFDLYKKCYIIFIGNNPEWYKYYNSFYFDEIILFLSLLEYINGYNFKEFKDVSNEEHTRLYNNYFCYRMESQYEIEF